MTEQDYRYPTAERHDSTPFNPGDQLDFQRANSRMLSPEAVRALRLVDEAYAAPVQEKAPTFEEQAAVYILGVGASLAAARDFELPAA